MSLRDRISRPSTLGSARNAVAGRWADRPSRRAGERRARRRLAAGVAGGFLAGVGAGWLLRDRRGPAGHGDEHALPAAPADAVRPYGAAAELIDARDDTPTPR